MLRLAMIGLGAIGSSVLEALRDGTLTGIDCPVILVKNPRPFKTDDTLPVFTHDPELFFRFQVDAVLEVAGHAAVQAYGQRVLENGADLLVTSVGAFTDEDLLKRCIATAKAQRCRLILPSAGIGALDILAAGAIGGLETVILTVRKDPSAWRGTLADQQHDLGNLREAVTLYEGPVRGGAAAYPQNVNIAAAVALAGLGLDDTTLRIIADPTISNHVVEVEAHGAFGRFSFREDVVPTEDNPKTGKLVGMAVIKTIRQLSSPLVVGW